MAIVAPPPGGLNSVGNMRECTSLALGEVSAH
jgi:hypothetical protein